MLKSEDTGYGPGSGGPLMTDHVICPGCAHNFPAISQSAQDRLAELEGDLSVVRLQLSRIDEQLVGSYGEIETMSADAVRRILRNVAYIVNPNTR